MTIERFDMNHFEENDPDIFFNELLQSIMATMEHRGISYGESPEVIQHFYHPALLVGHTTISGLWEYLVSYMQNDVRFDEERKESVLNALKVLKAKKSATALNNAFNCWVSFIADPGPHSGRKWKAAEKTINEIERSVDMEAEILPKAIKYAMAHVQEFDSFDLVSG